MAYSKNILPTRVSVLDDMIDAGGLERGSTVLVSGGCGTGKTLLTLESLYKASLQGEKSVFLTCSEDPEKIRQRASNFGWDVEKQEAEDKFFMAKIDPFKLAVDVANVLREYNLRETGVKDIKKRVQCWVPLIDNKDYKIPFTPDRIALDSVSALKAAISRQEEYRICVQTLIEALNQHESSNILISESQQDPHTHQQEGIVEYLVDGVILLYTIRKGQLRRNALEIIKLRHSNHLREMVPYMITNKGIKILKGEKIL
ncbi:MAG: hypothetical protein GF334_12080 [Candidatus Altiarchaeales archaeon]|nr:hypothetical protein [Candidatus Altiarchaeales archaeon]